MPAHKKAQMEKPKVQSLFKYCQLSTRSLYSLSEERLWYPSALAFNDPFDCSVIDFAHKFQTELDGARRKIIQRPKMPKSNDPSEALITKRIRKIHKEFFLKESAKDHELLSKISSAQQLFQKIAHNFGILCLSETPKNILMWSHYAQNHTGLCMEFERTPENKLGVEASPVQYVRSRLTGSDSGLIFEKHVGWKYEREWRVLEKKANQLYPFPGKLLSVICGAKMTEENRILIQRLIQSKNNFANCNVKIIDAEMNPLKYEILLKNRASTE